MRRTDILIRAHEVFHPLGPLAPKHDRVAVEAGINPQYGASSQPDHHRPAVAEGRKQKPVRTPVSMRSRHSKNPRGHKPGFRCPSRKKHGKASVRGSARVINGEGIDENIAEFIRRLTRNALTGNADRTKRFDQFSEDESRYPAVKSRHPTKLALNAARGTVELFPRYWNAACSA